HVMPSLEFKSLMLKQIESKIKVSVAFRALQSDSIIFPKATSFSWRLSVRAGAEKPRWHLVALQTARSGNQATSPGMFDHVQVRNTYAFLNSHRYPMVDRNLNFVQYKTSRAYKNLRYFKEEYY